jgi:hypothetical protein
MLALLIGACSGRPPRTVADISSYRTDHYHDSIGWPSGTDTARFENLDGVILVDGALTGAEGRDTTGALVLDTGSGFLALDDSLAMALGLADGPARATPDLASRPLARVTFGSATRDLVAPVLLFDSDILARIAGRPVLGLIGYRLVRDRVLWIDYQAGTLAMIPGGPDLELGDTEAVAASRRLLGGLSSAAVPVRFRMAGDGKVLLPVRLTPLAGGRPTPWLTFVLDTGASRCVVFEDAVEPLARVSRWRPEVRGLRAPTLFGSTAARLTVSRLVELRGAASTATAARVETALLTTPMARQLARVAGEPVHGLVGYAFLQRFRIACDYPRRVLWLDPVPGRRVGAAERGHVGLQLERAGGRVRVVAVVEGSPAAGAGIRAGDEIVGLDREPVAEMSGSQLARRLEGPPGTSLTITLRRGETERTYRLRRKRLF